MSSSTVNNDPLTPLTPGFEELSFIAANQEYFGSANSDFEDSPAADSPDIRKTAFHYEPGVIRRMKKSEKYAMNNDVFESKSRPVSVASLLEDQDLGQEEGEPGDKQSKFNNVHKPVLFLKSCPSPATFLHKKHVDPDSLLSKLSVLETIINDINDVTLDDSTCIKCGFEHHITEQCLLSPDVFSTENSDTEIHCNPLFNNPGSVLNPNQDKISGKRKKRRKLFKFGGKNKRDTSDSD